MALFVFLSFFHSFISFTMAFVTMQSGSKLVPAKEIIQDNCCECGGAFDVHWDAWSGTGYHYPYAWEEYTVFCSAKCMEAFEATVCHYCCMPRSCCMHAQMEYDYEEEADDVSEELEDNDRSVYRELHTE